MINPNHPALTGIKRVLRRFSTEGSPSHYAADIYDGVEPVEADLSSAEIVTSQLHESTDLVHAPVIDFDIPVHLVPSSTPGHSHLYIDVPVTKYHYRGLLKALTEASLVEKEFLRSFDRRGYTAVRLPWVKKPGVGVQDTL